jgi:hypothetical protein
MSSPGRYYRSLSRWPEEKLLPHDLSVLHLVDTYFGQRHATLRFPVRDIDGHRASEEVAGDDGLADFGAMDLEHVIESLRLAVNPIQSARHGFRRGVWLDTHRIRGEKLTLCAEMISATAELDESFGDLINFHGG